jgi:hypothetical protein
VDNNVMETAERERLAIKSPLFEAEPQGISYTERITRCALHSTLNTLHCTLLHCTALYRSQPVALNSFHKKWCLIRAMFGRESFKSDEAYFLVVHERLRFHSPILFSHTLLPLFLLSSLFSLPPSLLLHLFLLFNSSFLFLFLYIVSFIFLFSLSLLFPLSYSLSLILSLFFSLSCRPDWRSLPTDF